MAAEAEMIEDPTLSPLLEEGFEAKAFATATIQNQMVGDTLQKLANGIAALDKELYSQVVTNYEDLLSQATGIEALEGVLKMMQTRIESLRTAVDRIGSKVIEPYHVIVSRTRQLARLQSVCDLLRKVIRMLYLLKRLKSQLQGGTREITKVAQTFNEIDQLSCGGELNGVRIVEDERAWLARARREVESQAKKMLMQGLELMNPSQVGVALQVFHNLAQLPSSLLTILTGYKEAIQHDIQNALDPATLVQASNGSSSGGPGRASLPIVGSAASWKAILWTRLDQLVTSIQKAYSQIHQLHTVLVKKRDPHTQVPFLDSIAGTPAHHLLTNFWETITEDLAVELQAAAKASIFLNQAFESDYPKLVKVFTELLNKIEQFSTVEARPSLYLQTPLLTTTINEAGSPYEAALLKALSPFEKSYISRSLSRLFDSVNQLFAPGSRTMPTQDDLHSTIRTITSELAAAGNSSALAGIIARNVEKTVKLFNMKCEQAVQCRACPVQELALKLAPHLATGRDAVQVAGPPNKAQLKNVGIANSLYAFSTLVTQHILSLSSVPSNANHIISSALEGSEAQMCSVVSLFVNEVLRVLEEMIVSMHQENFGSEVQAASVSGTPDLPCSGYMRELHSFTARMHSQHLSLYHCTGEVQEQLRGVCVRVLELFVRHVCLVRPLREGGKMKITTDMTQIELALTPFCTKPAELGQPYRMLRALRGGKCEKQGRPGQIYHVRGPMMTCEWSHDDVRLLFLNADNSISESAGLGEQLPYSYALHHLFSRAPSDMASPHQLQGWTEKAYSDWMDKQTPERDRLAFIQATLDTYAKRVRGQMKSQYASIYPVMVSLLKRGMEREEEDERGG